jgi:uncharacterized protein (DUF4213/DUF364 family)
MRKSNNVPIVDVMSLFQPDDQVGMVGFIEPMVNQVEQIASKKLYIFDRSHKKYKDIYPETHQK